MTERDDCWRAAMTRSKRALLNAVRAERPHAPVCEYGASARLTASSATRCATLPAASALGPASASRRRPVFCRWARRVVSRRAPRPRLARRTVAALGSASLGRAGQERSAAR